MSNIKLPKTVVLEMTYKCNHKCLFCSCPWYSPKHNFKCGTELNIDQWIKVFDKLERQGVEYLSFSGGEVLLKDGFLELLSYIRRCNHFNKDVTIVVISNGLAMSEEYLKEFKRLNVHLSMSLPGLETFERHTGVDNAGGVLYWFSQAKKLEIPTTVNITVTAINYYELYETLANGLIAGADTVLINRFLAGGRGLEHVKELTLNREQLNGMLQTTEKVLDTAKRKGSIGTEFPRCVVDNIEQYKHLTIASICSAGKDFWVIDPSGQVRVCNHSPRVVGNILDEQIVSDKDYWNTFATRNYIPSSCVSCKDVSYCDCGCRETASILYDDVRAIDPSLVTPCNC